MKKIALILFIIITILILVSCNGADEGVFVSLNEETSARFQRIGIEKFIDVHDTIAIEEAVYYVDRHTNIVYVYAMRLGPVMLPRGMMTVLYNAEGKPITLEEFEKGEE